MVYALVNTKHQMRPTWDVKLKKNAVGLTKNYYNSSYFIIAKKLI